MPLDQLGDWCHLADNVAILSETKGKPRMSCSTSVRTLSAKVTLRQILGNLEFLRCCGGAPIKAGHAYSSRGLTIDLKTTSLVSVEI